MSRLQGGNPLAQQNHNQSTHAYDKHLLLRIGKSHSPDHSKSDSREHLSKLSIQTKGPNVLASPAREPSSWDKYMTSPTSAISPVSKFSWQEYSMDPRSPASESTSFTMELGFFSRHVSARPRMKPTNSSEDTRARSERGSCDSAYSVGDEQNFIEERPRLAVYHGTKRRALSPPREADYEKRQEPLKRLQSRSDLQVTTSNQPYETGSLSSTASSNHCYSYASSNILSSVSMTSISSMDTSLSREPSRQLFASPTSADSTSGVAILPPRRAPEPLNKTANHWICSCCPKKPRKFETEDQLRTHENEKQYTCTYCYNRFKNKNEAERHQNSLHLRKQSWSCATISTYQAAFYLAFPNSRNLATDTCGYCGEEFSSQPPNLEERIEHLTNVHKFGECNATKKFYRADHFRQHLKHSHAGKIGKWTKVLENNCQQEEAPSKPASLSPTASEHSQSSKLANPTDASVSEVEMNGQVAKEP